MRSDRGGNVMDNGENTTKKKTFKLAKVNSRDGESVLYDAYGYEIRSETSPERPLRGESEAARDAEVSVSSGNRSTRTVRRTGDRPLV